MNYKKKRYDIHIRMFPEDFEMLHGIISLIGWRKPFYKKEIAGRVQCFEDFVWRLHNKMVKINRR